MYLFVNYSKALQEVADFIAFLKFRDRRQQIVFDTAQLAMFATEFAEEDRTLAKAGMSDYATLFEQEDKL
ncbi:MAG: hypothetical protein HC890_05840 [Chloroflexaceae bacterium]|nr:hypothetical protein [Chloroflexaceae bacterium]